MVIKNLEIFQISFTIKVCRLHFALQPLRVTIVFTAVNNTKKSNLSMKEYLIFLTCFIVFVVGVHLPIFEAYADGTNSKLSPFNNLNVEFKVCTIPFFFFMEASLFNNSHACLIMASI